MQRGIGLNNEDGDEVAHVGLTQTRQEIHLTVSTVTDRAATQVTADLTPEECDELAGALKDVAAVARAYGEDFTVRAPGRGHILGWRS